jgi:hypothetical protein
MTASRPAGHVPKTVAVGGQNYHYAGKAVEMYNQDSTEADAVAGPSNRVPVGRRRGTRLSQEGLSMNLDFICTLMQPWVNLAQSMLAFAWTPLTWFGLAVPSIADFLNLFLPCQLS